MLTLRVVQAEEGDCLILRHGTKQKPRFVLIDGGPRGNYAANLRPELLALAKAGHRVELMMLSHVDNDHVLGLLDFLVEQAATPVIDVGELWHNAFSSTVGAGSGGDIEPRVRALASAGSHAKVAAATVLGIGEGHRLVTEARAQGIPVNAAFGGKPILARAGQAPVTLGGLKLTVIGPTKANLEALRKKWHAWLDEREDARPEGAAMSDRSIPNLSSLMLLAESGGKRLLLTGDGRGDHLVQGLEETGLLEGGRLHVDVFKLAHHGSDRNTTRELFERITADVYVASANGKDGNPDIATLEWIVEAAQAGKRKVKLMLTNTTPDVKAFVKRFPPAKSGYTISVMPRTQRAFEVVVAP